MSNINFYRFLYQLWILVYHFNYFLIAEETQAAVQHKTHFGVAPKLKTEFGLFYVLYIFLSKLIDLYL